MASTKSTSKAPAKKPVAKPVAKAETKAEATAPASTPAQKPIHVETPSGFQVDIRPELWDDMELLELMAWAWPSPPWSTRFSPPTRKRPSMTTSAPLTGACPCPR